MPVSQWGGRPDCSYLPVGRGCSILYSTLYATRRCARQLHPMCVGGPAGKLRSGEHLTMFVGARRMQGPARRACICTARGCMGCRRGSTRIGRIQGAPYVRMGWGAGLEQGGLLCPLYSPYLWPSGHSTGHTRAENQGSTGATARGKLYIEDTVHAD